MDEEPSPLLNTREFVARWNVAKEEHLVQRFTAVAAALARRGVLPPLSEAQGAILAHALQLAAEPGAGPPVALQYLEALAGESAGDTSPQGG